jgi:hypothetical protein
MGWHYGTRELRHGLYAVGYSVNGGDWTQVTTYHSAARAQGHADTQNKLYAIHHRRNIPSASAGEGGG